MTQSTIGDLDRRDHLARLLHRYPKLTAGETDEVLAFLKNGALIDIGMLKGDATIRTRIDRVQRDHAEHFTTSLGQRLTVTALLVGPVLLMCVMAWYWGTK